MAEIPSTVDQYIASFPNNVQDIMQQVRKTILENAPDAVESISWGMPGYKVYGKPLVYFAGHKHHLGFYGTPTVHPAFAKELKGYKQGKGSIQFPYDNLVPFELIGRMVRFRAHENEEKLLAKKRK